MIKKFYDVDSGEGKGLAIPFKEDKFGCTWFSDEQKVVKWLSDNEQDYSVVAITRSMGTFYVFHKKTQKKLNDEKIVYDILNNRI